MIKERRKTPRTYTSWDDVPVVMSLTELCVLLGMSYPVLSKKCNNGEIPCRKVNKQWRFDRDAVRDFLKGEQNDAKGN